MRSLLAAVLALLAFAMEDAGARGDDTRDLGRLRADRPVEIGLVMRHRNDAELAALVRLQGEQSSPLYHRYLTNSQWNAYFAPDPAAYRRAVALLERAGFTVSGTLDDRSLLRVRAPAGIAERFFSTRFHAVDQGPRGVLYRNVTPIVVPSALRSLAVDISGFDATVRVRFPLRLGMRGMRPAEVTHAAAAPVSDAAVTPSPRPTPSPSPSPTAVSIATTTPIPNPSPDPTLTERYPPLVDYAVNTGYGPPIFGIAYDFPVQHGYGGSHQAIASVIDADYSSEAAATEFAMYKIPRTGAEYRVYTDGIFTNTVATDENEADIDEQVIVSLAPAAKFYEYLTRNLNELGIEGAYARIVSDNLVSVVNSSFTECETNSPSFEYSTNYLATEGAAKGITFVAASGDFGSDGCGALIPNPTGITVGTDLGVGAPCADTVFVCVGGTAFEPITDDNAYTGEIAWAGSGGGVSVLEPIPDWQATTPNVITSGRNVPDVAFSADFAPPGVAIVINNADGIQEAGGTSVASPMFCALQAEINQARHTRHGFVTPRLYEIGNEAESFAFRDVTEGANGLYLAKKGYDNTTGFGSALGFELAGAE